MAISAPLGDATLDMILFILLNYEFVVLTAVIDPSFICCSWSRRELLK